ncbi:MAG: hypothetical protein V9G42_06010 [Bacteroidia bacterium]
MENQEAKRLASAAFKLSKDAKEMYVTSDGTCFTSRNDANNHSFTLKDKEVHTFEKPGLNDDGHSAEAELKAKAEAEAELKAEVNKKKSDKK